MEENDETVLNEEKEQETNKKGFNKILLLIIGIAIGLIIMIILNIFGITFNKKTIATVNGKSVTEETLFNKMKEYYGLNFLLEEVDTAILEKKYTLDEGQQEEVNKQADNYISMYEAYYGYSEEEFLTKNGFSNYDDFIKYLSLDYKRDLYVKEYAKNLISYQDIKDYYEDNVYGDIDSKHILVKVSDKVTEEQALSLAKEIIAKLDKGATFDEVKEEYADKITYEELGYTGFNSGLEESYTEALKKLEDGTYSKEPVETSYGYHIVYRIGQKEVLPLEEVKNDILEKLVESTISEDDTISYKALIEMREEAGLKIKDEDILQQYNEYCNQFEEKDMEETNLIQDESIELDESTDEADETTNDNEEIDETTDGNEIIEE